MGNQNVAAGIFAVAMGTVSLQPGGVTGPETVWMTQTKLAVLPVPADPAFSCVLPSRPASPTPGCVTRTRTAQMARMNVRIALGPHAQVSR